jgi:hypothetical protein
VCFLDGVGDEGDGGQSDARAGGEGHQEGYRDLDGEVEGVMLVQEEGWISEV